MKNKLVSIALEFAECLFPPSKDPIEFRSNVSPEEDKSVNAVCLRILVAHAFECGVKWLMENKYESNEQAISVAKEYGFKKETKTSKLLANSFYNGILFGLKFAEKHQLSVYQTHNFHFNYTFVADDNQKYTDTTEYETYSDAYTNAFNQLLESQNVYFYIKDIQDERD